MKNESFTDNKVLAKLARSVEDSLIDYERPGRYNHVASFSIQYHTEFGQHLVISGSHKGIGEWDVGRAINMVWSEGDVWKCDLNFKAVKESDTKIEYKYAVKNACGILIRWETGKNHVVELAGNSSSSFDFWNLS